MKAETCTTSDNSLTMLLAGVGIGSVATLLFTRYSGADLRRRIARSAESGKNLLKSNAESLVGRAEAASQTGHDSVERHLVDGREAALDLCDKTKDAIVSATDAASTANDHLLDRSAALGRRATQIIQTA